MKKSSSETTHPVLPSLAALAMGVVEKLAAKLGRLPNAQEVAEAKAKRAAKKARAEGPAAGENAAAALPPMPPSTIKLEILHSRIKAEEPTESKPEPKGELVVLDAVGAKANCLLTLTGNKPDKTIDDIRGKAANAFGVANGWQIYLGQNVSSAVFIGGADGGTASFIEEFEILMLDKVYKPKAFAVECLKGSEALRSSKPMQQPTGAVFRGTAEAASDAAAEVISEVHATRACHARAMPCTSQLCMPWNPCAGAER